MPNNMKGVRIMKKLLVMLLVVALTCTMALAGAVAETKIGVSIMELTAYPWYLGVIQGCNDWAADHPDAGFTFQFEDSHSDVSTMLKTIRDTPSAAWGVDPHPTPKRMIGPVIHQP